MVEARVGEVGPYRAVVLAVHNAFFKTFEHLFLAFEVGLRLVIYLVEVHAHTLVCLVETGVYPVVHHFPKAADFGVFCFPAAQHVACFGHQGRSCLCSFFAEGFVGFHHGADFGFVMLVEVYVAVTYEVVALYAQRLGSFAIVPFLPCEHRLADVYAAVVHYVGFHHTVATGFENLGQRISQQVVAHVAQVQGLVGVRRRVFHHHQRRPVGGCTETVVGVCRHRGQHLTPHGGAYNQVQKAFHYVVTLYGRLMFKQIIADFLAYSLGSLAGGLHPGENYYGEVAFEFFAGRLGHKCIWGGVNAVKLFHSSAYGTAYNCIYCHFFYLIFPS